MVSVHSECPLETEAGPGASCKASSGGVKPGVSSGATWVGLSFLGSPAHIMGEEDPPDSASRRRYGVLKKITKTQVKRVHRPASSSRDTVQSRGSSPCRQVEKDGPVRRTVTAVNSSMMSTPSACLDTQGPQPRQKNSLSTMFNVIVGREQHLCQPLQPLLLPEQYIVLIHTCLAAGPGLHMQLAQACTQQVHAHPWPEEASS